MKILAVDTSTLVAAVAVVEDTRLLGEYNINHKKTHSQRLVPMIDEIMKNLELTPQDIDIYAASNGPGSFTGLRIGITTIKAIAYAAGKPVISVPALDALAYNIPMTDSLVCPMMDARNNQVYTAVYKWQNGRQIKTTEYIAVPVSELVEIIKDMKHKTIFTGDAVDIHREFLKSELGSICGFAPVCLLSQKGSSVAQVALIRASEGLLENCFDMVPFYLRKPQAEREYDLKARP